MAMPVWALPRWLQGFEPIAVGGRKKKRLPFKKSNRIISLVSKINNKKKRLIGLYKNRNYEI